MAIIENIGIISSFAFPAYSDYIKIGQLIEAKTGLLELSSQMETYRNSNPVYPENTTGGAAANQIASPQLSRNGYYTMAIVQSDASSFIILATPTALGSQDNYECKTFGIDHNGITYTGSLVTGVWVNNGLATTCWNK